MMMMDTKTIVTNLLLLILLQISNFPTIVLSMEARYRKDYKSEYKVNPDTVTHIVVSNELYGLKKGNAGFVCSHGPKKWRQSKPGDRYILLKFKHNVHVTVVSYAGRSHFVTTELKIRNGMQGLKRPEIVYHCQAINSGLDYGWRRALRPPFGHSFHVLLEGGQKLEEEIHRCHFRSVLGTVDVDIRMTAIDAEICNFRKACAVHEVTPEGIMFDGKEWNFEERYPRLIPKKYLEAKWKPWPRRTSRNSGGQASGRRSSGDVGFTLMMKNEMFGLKRPSVLYRCKAYDKSLRWHVSIPTAEFTWDFEVPPFGTGVVIHRCEFKSSQGTADVEIKTLSMTSTLCGGHLCKYVIRPNGVYFVGFETYYPHNIFLRFLEFVRPVDKLVEPWKAWSPRQLKALRERTNNRTRLHEDNNRTRLHGDKDADEDEKDDD
ncbi:putative plant self-incompatibility S1 [Arabidopsis thaliana]|uniref:Plant self-incompatibility protein S1 family n=2 Tax=Arabidopsis TaxID=3701 RepID=A0A178UJ15_ARATH|nr:hypothetical protein AXX17_AT5G26080 [Arabidopsis thaliana]